MLGLGYRLLGALLVLSSAPGSASGLDTSTGDSNDLGSLHFYIPTPSLAIPTWYTTTSSASASVPTSSIFFAFAEIQNTTVCGSESISWYYEGDASNILGLAITSVDTTSGDPVTDVLTIMDGGLGNFNTYVWSPVAVPEGVYSVAVSIPNADLLYYSSTFYVFNSSDNTCLNSSSTSATSDPTSTSVSGTSSSTSSAGDATNIPVVGAASSGSSLSGGSIAGVAIGSLAFVAGLIAILIILRRCRNRSASGVSRSGFFEKKPPKGAVAISSRGGSFSSTHGAAEHYAGAGYGRGGSYSGRFPSGSVVEQGHSDEDVASLSLAGEKPVAHAPSTAFGGSVAIPVPVHRTSHTYRDSTGSVVSGTTAVGSPPGVVSYSRPSRHSSVADPFKSELSTPSPRPSGDYRPTGSQSQVPVALFSPSSNTSSPRSFGSPGVPRDISIASSSSPDLVYDSDFAGPTAAARRAPPAPPVAMSTASAAQLAWRAKSASTRKPVPVYAPSVSGEALELVEPVTPRSTASTGAGSSYHRSSAGQHSGVSLVPSSSAGGNWSSAAAHSHSSTSGASPTSSGTHLSPGSAGVTPTSPSTLVGRPGFAGQVDLPELNHKSSFGDRQMHVLIPDPPPQEMR